MLRNGERLEPAKNRLASIEEQDGYIWRKKKKEELKLTIEGYLFHLKFNAKTPGG